MLPAFAYGIGLLGLNLLFGYTGLLSFGHALFVALGAYTAAVLTTHFRVLHLEVILRGGGRGGGGGGGAGRPARACAT